MESGLEKNLVVHVSYLFLNIEDIMMILSLQLLTVVIFLILEMVGYTFLLTHFWEQWPFIDVNLVMN